MNEDSKSFGSVQSAGRQLIAFTKMKTITNVAKIINLKGIESLFGNSHSEIVNRPAFKVQPESLSQLHILSFIFAILDVISGSNYDLPDEHGVGSNYFSNTHNFRAPKFQKNTMPVAVIFAGTAGIDHNPTNNAMRSRLSIKPIALTR